MRRCIERHTSALTTCAHDFDLRQVSHNDSPAASKKVIIVVLSECFRQLGLLLDSFRSLLICLALPPVGTLLKSHGPHSLVVDVQAEGSAAVEGGGGLLGGIHIPRLTAHHDALLVVHARLQPTVPYDLCNDALCISGAGHPQLGGHVRERDARICSAHARQPCPQHVLPQAHHQVACAVLRPPRLAFLCNFPEGDEVSSSYGGCEVEVRLQCGCQGGRGQLRAFRHITQQQAHQHPPLRHLRSEGMSFDGCLAQRLLQRVAGGGVVQLYCLDAPMVVSIASCLGAAA
mmetsp:Transcript_9527/g.28661  ORF Transcript_9527/g.28661 Transcript_9527/m.28661 type:complete len:288 (+) Transcript_9527:169-1032(+)